MHGWAGLDWVEHTLQSGIQLANHVAPAQLGRVPKHSWIGQ